MRVIVTVPNLKLATLNVREHHMARAKRVKGERLAVFAALSRVDAAAARALKAAARVTVRFTRIGRGTLDTDNVVGSCKAVRDEVAKWLGKSDAPGSGVEWVMPVAQERGGWAVRIELECEAES